MVEVEEGRIILIITIAWEPLPQEVEVEFHGFTGG
jgi:hypothetical protein